MMRDPVVFHPPEVPQEIWSLKEGSNLTDTELEEDIIGGLS
jgi:hypothetical protein